MDRASTYDWTRVADSTEVGKTIYDAIKFLNYDLAKAHRCDEGPQLYALAFAGMLYSPWMTYGELKAFAYGVHAMSMSEGELDAFTRGVNSAMRVLEILDSDLNDHGNDKHKASDAFNKMMANGIDEFFAFIMDMHVHDKEGGSKDE